MNSNAKDQQLFSQMFQNLSLLPRRSQSNTGQFVCQKHSYFATTLFQVKFQRSLQFVFQYQMKHQYPDDSAQVFDLLIRSIRPLLKKEIKLISFSGNTLFGLAKVSNKQSYEAQVKKTQTLVTITLKKEIPVVQFLNQPDTRPIALQFLNSELKTHCKDAGMCEIGKIGKFFGKGQLDIKNDQRKKKLTDIGLNVLQGYQFTLIYLNHTLNLKVDVCSRVLQRKSVLQLMDQGFPLVKLIGSTVKTRYGNYRTYKIEEVLTNENPRTVFHNQKLGKEMTYLEYYRNYYGMKIQNERQPLLKVVSRVRKEIKNHEIIQTPIYIRLLPELVSPTGMTDAQRSEHYLQHGLSPFTKFSPQERILHFGQAVELLNHYSEIFSIDYRLTTTDYLKPIKIKTEHDKVLTIKNGRINLKGMKQSIELMRWLVVYSVGDNQDRDRGAIDNVLNLIYGSGKRLNLMYKKPLLAEVRGRVPVDRWKHIILQQIFESGKPQLVMVLLKKHEATVYGQLKSFLLLRNIPSQFAQIDSFGKKGMSVAENIGIQMNVKIHGVPWEVSTSNDYFKNKNCAFGGLSISKGKKGYSVAFVGSVNSSGSKYYSHYKIGVNRKGNIPNYFFNQSFYQWLKNFYKFKGMPDVVLYYRQSIGNTQFKVQVEQEINILRQVFKKIEKSLNLKFQPEVIVFQVIKKGGTRFFDENGQRIKNPSPGSVMKNLEGDDEFGFHLVPQYVNQGTCSPTHFKVVYDTAQIPEKELIHFTYEQCYNYYNWCGPVKMPGVMQYAKKLATQAREGLETLQNEAIKQTLYFI